MNLWKKRLLVFLCVILVVPSLLQVLPTSTISQVEAGATMWGTYALQRDFRTNKVLPVTVEVGEKVNLSYFFMCAGSNSKAWSLAEEKKGVRYSSSKPSVVSVNKEGLINPMKTGSAPISITFIGKTESVPIKVVKKGKLKLSSFKKQEKSAKEFLKVCDKKITSKNQYEILKKYLTFRDCCGAGYELRNKIDENGLKVEKSKNPNGPSYVTKNVILAPNVAKAKVKSMKVLDYFKKRSPVGTNTSKWFKVKKVNVPNPGATTFTIALKNKVTASQLYSLQAQFGRCDGRDNMAEFWVWLVDDEGKVMDCYGKVKKGSDKIECRLTNGGGMYASSKKSFSPGTYKLKDSWLNRKFTVK